MLPETDRQTPKDELKEAILAQGTIPTHVAVIMDGNGRWAKRRGRLRIFGHLAGRKSVREAVIGCRELGVKYLTLYTFSVENWQRPPTEVSALMRILKQTLKEQRQEMRDNGICLETIGRVEDLPRSAQNVLRETQEFLAGGKDMTLVLALSYGGRDEIARAARELAREVGEGRRAADSIDEAAVRNKLYTASIPDPDLVIRTSGEVRVSNFMLWQAAYSEIWVTDVLWPDFRKEHLFAAIRGYQHRERRIASALVLGPVAVWSVVEGGWFFTVFLGAALLLGLHELFRLGRSADIPVPRYSGLFLASVLVVLAALHNGRYSGLALIVASLWIVAQSFRRPPGRGLYGLTFAVFGVAYVVGLGIHMLWLRELPHGDRLLLLALLGTWAADAGAFFAGITWGKRPLAPAISPNKTVEGFVGGLILTVAVTVAAGHLLLPQVFSIGPAVILGVLIGVVAPIGDLLESFIKRSLGAKDTARLIPGHGGVLDRIDSLLFTVPITFYAVRLFTRTL